MGLKVEHIDKSFDQLLVIKDLSMEVEEGSIFGFLGPNGAGKTTTMRMILDIIRPDRRSHHLEWLEDTRHTPSSFRISARRAGTVPKGRGAGAVGLPGSLEWVIKGCCSRTPG